MSSARMAVEDRAVDVDGKALRLGRLDADDRLLEAAFHAHRLVVVLLQAVEMHREEQIGRRLEQMQLLLEQQRVGAQRDELLARHDAFDDLADLLVDERLAAGDGDHRRAALVDRVEAFLHRQPPVQDRVRIVDLAAAEAGEIAAEQRLQHQHQRIALAPHELLLEQISADAHFLQKRNRHATLLSCLLRPAARLAVPSCYDAFSEFRRQSEFDVLLTPGQHETSTGPKPAQGVDHVVDQHLRRRSARR